MKLSNDFKRYLRLSPLANSRLYHLMRFMTKRKDIDAVIKKFEGGVDEKRHRAIVRGMRKAMTELHWGFEEYYLFGYESQSKEARKQFVPEYDKNIFCDRVNDCEAAKVFYDKWKTYDLFSRYFKRDAIMLRNVSDIRTEGFRVFAEKNHDFIYKPLFAACGRGIEVFRTTGVDDAGNKLKTNLLKGGGIIEGLIIQDDRMAIFHHQSVNTVRVITLRLKDRIEIIHPFMRVGRGGAVVDNAGAGGILGNVEVATGRVYAACDEAGHRYEVHPDTGVPIVGFVIPRWDEALAMVKELSNVLPQVRYVGWDLALTRDGWVLVEGNDKCQFVFQFPLREGFKKELDKLKMDL